MMMLAPLMALFCALLAVSDASIHRVTIPTGWMQETIIESSATTEIQFKFSISMKENSIDSLKKLALDVNDPRSTNYGKFLTSNEIESMTVPSQERLSKVTSWLRDSGVVDFTVKAHRIEFECARGLAEKMFETTFVKLKQPTFGQDPLYCSILSNPTLVSHIHV